MIIQSIIIGTFASREREGCLSIVNCWGIPAWERPVKLREFYRRRPRILILEIMNMDGIFSHGTSGKLSTESRIVLQICTAG